jgi:kynurenine 3-monooxygenase
MTVQNLLLLLGLCFLVLNTKVIDAFASRAQSFSVASIATSTTFSLHGRCTQSHSTIRLGASIEVPTRNTEHSNNDSALTPKAQYDSIICGGGPAGLLSAIMLSQKYGSSHRIAVCERRPTIPPSPIDDTVWNDVARFYLLGIGNRGQTALRAFGAYDDFEKVSVAVNGRRDWQPGMTNVQDGKITPAKKDVVSRVLPRDKLVGLLHHHIVEKYADANIDLLYGYDVEPMSFGNDDDKEQDFVTVRISKCKGASSSSESNTEAETDDGTYAASQDSEQLCSADGFSLLATTKLLIGADGSARTVANTMERFDAQRISKLNPIQRLFAEKPFKVTRFEDDNPRVFKSVPISLPAEDWPHDLNYSARSRDSRITLEALPSDEKGTLCALLLIKPHDEFAQSNADPKKLRSFFNEEFPQFSALISEEEIERVATKSASVLPAFRFAGPRLNMGKRTLILGDAAHTVKPYFGLGANTALEDVQMLSQTLDEAAASSLAGKDATDVVPTAVKLFSDRRAPDSAALVSISRNMDRPGSLFFVYFILPLILDGIFHKMAPTIFGPNIFAMFQRNDIGFKQIQTKKRLDRSLQVACLGTIFTGMLFILHATVGVLARATGKGRLAVSGGLMATAVVGMLLRQAVSGKEPTKA